MGLPSCITKFATNCSVASWHTNKQRFIELDEELHNAWLRTNENIANGTNDAIKIKNTKGKTTWSLSYNKLEDAESTSVLDKLPQIEISDLVSFIFNKCNIIKAFTHIKPYRSKRKPNLKNISACVFADAFGCGIGKMSEMSDLNFNQLNFTHKAAIRVETLKKASDSVVNYIAALGIFKRWNIIDRKLLGDADGQKFESRLQTIQARYSSKFFGLAKGISTYSLVTNNVPINSKNISPNDHESHFTFDIVYNNTSDIKPDMITGDAHSINQLNAFILDVINIRFVPIYKDIVGKSTSIYCIRDPKQYKGLIKPAGQIDMDLVEEQEENIQLLLFSLIMQETTQSIIVRKLASHNRHSRLKKALWEYNKILSSIHLLIL